MNLLKGSVHYHLSSYENMYMPLVNLAAPLKAWSVYYTTIASLFGGGGVEVVPASELASYKPLSEFARAAYCLRSSPTWTCGGEYSCFFLALSCYFASLFIYMLI